MQHAIAQPPQAGIDKIQQLRKNNQVGRLHHRAYLARDMEATRHFYEDILGLPLVGTWVKVS